MGRPSAVLPYLRSSSACRWPASDAKTNRPTKDPVNGVDPPMLDEATKATHETKN